LFAVPDCIGFQIGIFMAYSILEKLKDAVPSHFADINMHVLCSHLSCQWHQCSRLL